MEQQYPVLIVDDDAKLRALLTQYLEGYGYEVSTLPSGEGIIEEVKTSSPAIVILDIMMPGKDGLEVLRDLRPHSNVPVIMLTAKGEDTDRIVGLELGADDYISKPFNPRELLARIKAVLRRAKGPENNNPNSGQINVAGVVLHVAHQKLEIEGDSLELSSTEFKLLKALMDNPGRPMTRDDLMTSVWGKDFNAFDRSIDVHISKLRALFKPYPDHESRIKTVWGTGYMFVSE
ncbi:response regulator [Maridesulfovibrio salexigens]|uniref:Two component transcriptional regulator, winged helix family n=1 Tax=Maridesulfovibrio salexigens (strain ATCC 14822 / DSM 2638 / NCIMB 8403 / VKM B-1763) TaxID=526222 RepID=C6C1C7_MARSD|nr:response regulator transcription factor [Maridesulfovibrio salexigens]ACS81102.1 two component transcriptional regulator, winged helix family [Maridesulfovibrio salexigens DSM 2638]